jgi:hypothetical protein
MSPTTNDEGTQQNPSDELFNATSKSVLESAKATQEKALSELQKQMTDLTNSFADRAVAIVEEGMKECFFVASSRIQQIHLPDWIMSDGETLEGMVSPIALPGTITDGDTE